MNGKTGTKIARILSVAQSETQVAKDKTMRKYWLIGIICIPLFTICGFSSLAQELQGPKMFLEEQVFDFKEVREGAVITHSFKVFNHGNETLRILRVRPG